MQRISGVSVTLFQMDRPKVFRNPKSLTVVLSCAAIFCAVSGKYGSNRPAPIEMLYQIVQYSSQSVLLASSFASTHGSVSSIYFIAAFEQCKNLQSGHLQLSDLPSWLLPLS